MTSRSRARARRHPPGDGVPALGQPGAAGRPRRAAASPPRASTWSSSGAATPGPTASARRTVRARRRCTSSRSCRARPTTRAPTNPWPTWSNIFRVSSAHEEGGERVYSVNTECFLGDDDGNVRALRAHEVEMIDGKFEKIEGYRLRAALRARAAGHGLPRPAAARGCSSSSASSSTAAATWCATRRS